jgi:serine/threonine protein kinase
MDNPQTAQARQRVGTVLRGKWTLDALIGTGGMAFVYAATHRNGKRVAIKLLNPLWAQHDELRARFLREGYLANRVGHPGSLAVLDDDATEDGTVFLVMELLEGQPLQRRVAQAHGLEPVEALFITDQVLDILAAAHAQGIVHRDIKPGNIFLLRDGTVKLLDFGLARLKEGPAPKAGPFAEVLTAEGCVVGTVSFMAPEQARARHELVDGRTDLYALGATMFYALSGHTVHEAETPVDRLLLVMRQPARSLASLRPDLPHELVALVDRALAFEQGQRWQDAKTMQAAARAAYQAIAGRPIPVTARAEYHGAAGWLRPALSVDTHATSPAPPPSSLGISVVFEPDSAATSVTLPADLLESSTGEPGLPDGQSIDVALEGFGSSKPS